MCAVGDSGLHGKGQRVKAPSECSKWVVNSVSLFRDLPVFPGFFETIRVVNVRDQTTGNAILGNTYGLSDLLLIGWLQTRGSSRVNYVRADFEHNYKWIVFSSVSVSGADIKNFNLNVTYSKESMRWSRTAGSKRVEIPAS